MSVDVLDLKDLVRRQRQTLQTLREEGERLRRRVEEQEKTAVLTRQRLHVTSARSSTALAPDSLPSFDEKFLETDAKLEIRILSQDIRKALPLLEQQALSLESQLHASEQCAKTAMLAADCVPDAFKKSDEELQDELREVEKEISALSEAMEREVKDKSEERDRVERRVGRLKQELKMLIEERMLVQESKDMYELAYNIELQRNEIQKQHYDSLIGRLGQAA